jgi:hypothetical protein
LVAIILMVLMVKLSLDIWHVPNFLYRLKCESKVKTTEEQGVGARSLARNTFGVKGHVGVSRWGLGRVTSINYSHGPA